MQRGQFRIDPVFDDGHSLLDFLLFELPTNTNNNRPFIDGSTHVLVNESRFVDLGIELVIQHHLVLNRSIPIFPGYRTDVEHIIRTQEGFAQCGVTPLRLLAN